MSFVVVVVVMVLIPWHRWLDIPNEFWDPRILNLHRRVFMVRKRIQVHQTRVVLDSIVKPNEVQIDDTAGTY
jgi:hypothetical protein